MYARRERAAAATAFLTQREELSSHSMPLSPRLSLSMPLSIGESML